jgi:hypothetical protein
MLKHWYQELQIDLPNLMVSFFQPWGQYKAIKFSITSNFGQIEKIFSSSALTPSVKAFGADFNFCTNRNA